MPSVNTADRPRTRRAEKAERTAQRIITAAADLFFDPGYGSTTIEEIARRADVAVETVYSRFKNKPNILSAVIGTLITGVTNADELLQTPAYQAVAACTDQREQIKMMAALSRRRLQAVSKAHRILESAGSRDAQMALQGQLEYRMRTQRMLIDLLLANGPLRRGLSADEAGATYSSLSSPTNYLMLTEELGWSADRFEEWLRTNLERLLLPD